MNKLIDVEYRKKIYLFWVCYLLGMLLGYLVDPNIKSFWTWHAVFLPSISALLIGLSIFFTKKRW